MSDGNEQIQMASEADQMKGLDDLNLENIIGDGAGGDESFGEGDDIKDGDDDGSANLDKTKSKEEEVEDKSKEGEESGEDDDDTKGKGDDVDELTDEQVEEKLKKLEEKDAEELTDEDKAFIDEHTEISPLNQIYEEFGEIEGIDVSSYEDSIEGAINLSKDLANEKAKQVGTQLFQEALERIPEIAELYKHVAIEGKTLETFLLKNQQSDYSKFDLTNESGQKQMIRYKLETMNKLDSSSVNTLLQNLENEGKLEETAKTFKGELDTAKAETVKQREAAEAEAFQRQQQDNDKLISEAKTLIRGGKLGDLKLNAQQAKEFENQVLTEGLVAKTYDELSLEDRLALDYLTLNLKKLPELLKSGKTKKASGKKSFKESFGKKRTSPVKAAKDSKGGKSNDTEDIEHLNLDDFDLEQFYSESNKPVEQQ